MKGTDVRPEILRPFDPRHVPLPAPTPDICDAPTVTICVNAEWWSHLDGMISRLLYRDAWQGSNDEIDRAIESIQEILAVGKANPMGCGCGCEQIEVLHRVTEDGDLEVSYDGGVTWVPDPNDPRVTGTRLPNTIPGTGDDRKCNASTNCLENFKDQQAGFSNNLEQGQNILGLALQLASIVAALLFAPEAAPILIPLLITLATALVDILKTDYDAQFTNAVWDQLLCDIFCTIGDDGQFTQTQYNLLMTAIDADFTGNVALTFTGILRGWGLVGLNNACIAGAAATADCESCDCEDVWCYLFDFATAGTEDWEAIALGAGEFGQYVSGQYWDTTDAVDTIANPDQGERMAFIKRLFSARTITRVKVIYDYVKGVTDSATAPAIQIFLKDNSVWSRTFGEAADGNDQVAEWTGATAGIDEIRFHIRSSRDTTIPYAYSGTAHVKSILVEGMGSNPFGLDNCPEE